MKAKTAQGRIARCAETQPSMFFQTPHRESVFYFHSLLYTAEEWRASGVVGHSSKSNLPFIGLQNRAAISYRRPDGRQSHVWRL
jgi:hypothetical protein